MCLVEHGVNIHKQFMNVQLTLSCSEISGSFGLDFVWGRTCYLCSNNFRLGMSNVWPMGQIRSVEPYNLACRFLDGPSKLYEAVPAHALHVAHGLTQCCMQYKGSIWGIGCIQQQTTALHTGSSVHGWPGAPSGLALEPAEVQSGAALHRSPCSGSAPMLCAAPGPAHTPHVGQALEWGWHILYLSFRLDLVP